MSAHVHMEQMMRSLYEAASEGKVERLKGLIEQDKLILERCRTMKSYGETPLHIVAILGHLDFCKELVRINPGLVLELDSRESSALHFASARGHIDIVTTLVSVDPAMCLAMCLAYDGDGYIPVHLAAMKGRVDVLKELVNVCPDAVSARVKTCQGGNLLHLCVSYYQTEALKFSVELPNGNQLLNSVDNYGNSILHLAAADKQIEIIQYLVAQPSIDVNKKNSNGLTASDVLRLQPKRDSKYREIVDLLKLSSGQTVSSLSCGHLSETNSKKVKEQFSLDQQRNSLMVVASLIAAMAFQAGVNPPSGFKPGTHIYNAFVYANTTGFLSSLSVILLLISGLPIQNKVFIWTWTAIMWVSIIATTCTYTISLSTITDWTTYSVGFRIVVASWFDLMALLFLGHTIRILYLRIQDWHIKKKTVLWTFVAIMWIVAAVLGMPMPPIYSLHHHIPYSLFFDLWTVLSAILIVLYAIQLVSFIRENWESLFEKFNSHICVSTRASDV